MLNIANLHLGYEDAENYLQRQNKDFFNFVFVRNRFLDQILEPSRYFIIGEKGTGKTAYATFLANNHEFRNCVSSLNFIRETEYVKFIRLKKSNNLDLSDYSDIWVVILLLLLAHSLQVEEIDNNPISKGIRIKTLREAIDSFYDNAFSPEISQVMKFVEKSEKSVKIIQKIFNSKIRAQLLDGNELSYNSSSFQTNLLHLKNSFIEALSKLRLRKNHFLFIDGIDIRPGDIPYADYLDCVKGLANAVWRLNNDVFPTFRDTNGHFRVIMLMRPDIFNSLNLQNSANKMHDNSVILDWDTTYSDFRQSELFELANRFLSWNQGNFDHNRMWDLYFPWTLSDIGSERGYNDASFVYFLKMSYSRPRDIIAAIKCLKETALKKHMGDEMFFPPSLIMDAEFKNNYSEFLMMGIKDQLSFYYTEDEYQTFRNFFMTLRGKCEFSYNEYLDAFEQYSRNFLSDTITRPQFMSSANTFLQFLYSVNVVSYKEVTDRGTFFRWCYRERVSSNLIPRVELGGNYSIHYGLRKALNVGKALRIDKMA